MKIDLGVGAAEHQAHAPIVKPHAARVAARASARHITQLKRTIGLRWTGPDDAIMAAGQVLAREKAAGIQRIVAKRRRLDFLKLSKYHVRNHFERSVAERACVQSRKACAVLRFHLLDLRPPRLYFVRPGLGGGWCSFIVFTGNAADQSRSQRSQDY